MIKRLVEISREPTHVALRDRQLLLLRKGEPRPPYPAHPRNLAGSIPVEDIGMVVVDEGQATYTHAALAALVERGAVVVICGDDHLPSGLLLPMAEHTEVVWRLKDQIEASRPLRKRLWSEVITAKIRAQAACLPFDPVGDAAREQLLLLAQQVKSGDAENHEAQAARVYWQSWLGRFPEQADFQRVAGGRGPSAGAPPNNFLDYGYAILRAGVARALVSAGLLPALGLKHRNRSNAFCLADDLMEPLRPIVDDVARQLFLSGERRLVQGNKARLLILMTAEVTTPGTDHRAAFKGPLMVALHRYAASLAEALRTGKAERDSTLLDIPVRTFPRNRPWS